jgi:hypothetical protein
MDETVTVGEYDTVEEAYRAMGQYLDLLKVYNREEYDRVIENGFVMIRMSMREIEETRDLK